MENVPATIEGKGLIIYKEPREIVEEARKMASELAQIIKTKAHPVVINDEQYLEYEDWQLLALFARNSVKTRDAIRIEINGIEGAKAIAELLDETGTVIGGAEAYVMRDERKGDKQPWMNKPWFQLASMAQTRAGAKALSNKFRAVVMLAGFKGTPAEEMENVQNGKQQSDSSESNLPEGIVKIEKVEEKYGGTKEKPWTLYRIYDNRGVKYGTFDHEIGKLAKQFKAKQTLCTIAFDETQKGKTIKEIQEYMEREPGEEEAQD